MGGGWNSARRSRERRSHQFIDDRVRPICEQHITGRYCALESNKSSTEASNLCWSRWGSTFTARDFCYGWSVAAVSPQGLLSARCAPQEPTTAREVRATLVKVFLPFVLFLSWEQVYSCGHHPCWHNTARRRPPGGVSKYHGVRSPSVPSTDTRPRRRKLPQVWKQ